MTTVLQYLYKVVPRAWAPVVNGLLILTTPFVEKDPIKVLAARAPVVLSMTRLVVVAFAMAMLRHIWLRGIGAWPAATLSIAIVLALPIVSALDRVNPADVLTLAKNLFDRFGVGAISIASTEPSKFDDHRNDAG